MTDERSIAELDLVRERARGGDHDRPRERNRPCHCRRQNERSCKHERGTDTVSRVEFQHRNTRHQAPSLGRPHEPIQTSPERWRRGGGSPPPSLGVAGTTFGTETGWRAAQPVTARSSARRGHDAEYQCGVNTWFHARPLSISHFRKDAGFATSSLLPKRPDCGQQFKASSTVCL